MTPEKRPEVSVLIPAFNAEQTLEECLESVVSQSLRSLEVVCVDDGSTDRSAAIIRRYARLDARVRRVGHDRNRGEGAARNTAIENARGRFVFHLDADDLLPEHALETLWRVADMHGSQMVKGAYRMVSEEGRTLTDGLQATSEPVVNANLHSSAFLRKVPVSHCSYLYERAFLLERGLRYRTDMSVGLDLVALTACLVAASRVSIVPDVVYHYRQTDASVTRGRTKPDIVQDGIDAKRRVSKLLVQAGFEEASRNVLRTWDWQISAFWANLDPDTSEERVARLFSKFRRLIPPGCIPWGDGAPLHHRFILASILLGRDGEARKALTELREGAPFLESSELNQRLATILQVAPEDRAVAKVVGGPRTTRVSKRVEPGDA